MSDPYTPQAGPPRTAWDMDPYAQPVTGPPAPPPPAPSRTPWILGGAVVAVILLLGVSILLVATGAFDGDDTGGAPGTGSSGQPTKEQPADGTGEEPADPGTPGSYVFVDDVCGELDFSGYQALGALASGYEDRGADYGTSANLGCDMDFGDGGELRVGAMLAGADKTAENWDFAQGLIHNRTQEPAAGDWEEGVVGVDDTWGPGKTDAILAVRDGNIVVTVAFYSINDDVGYEKVKSLLPTTAAAVLAAAKG
ncbi:hypothetical protein [Phytomonospora endophytica]|uniref:DUF3558 domain-containing protein n=1 Tax=Phytomonospora endophytica TaxID=714109 RepID=A0A841FNM4_9ACTN|nr:hypothetical protein [Phytomonospora endophytica]MBB6036483.1 hypothetical protein [Phytomonospora endophytica]GIG65805.1 hypothetical protein Pen01_21000 [Phytomonospora endophytica]